MAKIGCLFNHTTFCNLYIQSKAKRQKFLTAKAKMTKLQKEKMKSIFDEKQAQRGKMADKLAKEYREQEDNTEALLAKAQVEY